MATSAGAPLMSGPSAPGTPAAQAEPPQDEEPAGNMLEVLFEMLLSTDMVYSRVYILYTASALYIKSYQFFYEEGILESEYIWLVSLAWIQYFRLLAGEAGNRGAFEAGNARAAAVHVILTPPVFLAQGYFLWHQSYQLHFEFVSELKGSIGEGPNHSNHSNHSNSFKIGIFRNFSFENSKISEIFNIF